MKTERSPLETKYATPEAEIDAMIADLESANNPNVEWAIEELRDARAEVEEFNRLAAWGEERAADWQQRLDYQLARALAILVLGGRMWQPGESAADIEREAERIRSGEAAPGVPRATREREAVLLEQTAKLLREKTALLAEMHATQTTVDMHVEDAEANHIARDRLLRGIARIMNDPELLRRLNRERRKGGGRKKPRGKK